MPTPMPTPAATPATTTAVTGASGSLGGQVVRLLAEQRTVDVVAVTRRPTAVPPGVTTRIADYADADALHRALAGVDTLVLVSSDGEGTRVLAHHLNVVAAARDRGVRHIVALSGVDADVDSPFCYAITNGLTEQAIRDSGCGFSLVRASVFAEFFLHFVLPARSTGQLLLPAGDGRLGLVSRLDVGRCLAALTRSAPTGEVHDITGPAALDVTAVAAIATKAWARPVTYRPITEPEYMKQLATAEDPWWAYAYTSMFASIREQRWDRVSDEVQRLTGRSPRTLWQLMAETASD